MHRPTLDEIKPIFTIAKVVLGTADMVDKGIKPTLRHLLLPSLAITYGAPIVMNSITNDFSITPRAAFTYLIALILSIYLYSNRIFLTLIQELPMLSKFLTCLELLDSSKRTKDIIVAQVAGYFAGAFIKKLALRRSMKMKRDDLLALVALNLGIFLIRIFRLPHLTMALAVYAIPIFCRLRNFLIQRRARRSTNKRQQPILHTPLSKLPRRRASVANIIENKNKEL